MQQEIFVYYARRGRREKKTDEIESIKVRGYYVKQLHDRSKPMHIQPYRPLS